jgi:ELWxxDGT repeat protein
MVFRVDDGVHGIELWITDGTPRGTRMIRDLCPGLCSGASYSEPLVIGARACFSGNSGSVAKPCVGAWVTDGTAQGTRLVYNPLPGGCQFFAPLHWRAAGGQAFFVLQDLGFSTPHLWRTDGTLQGTVQVTNLPHGGVSIDRFQGTDLGGSLLFTAEDPSFGAEPWISDGSPQGTRLLADLSLVDVGGSRPHDLQRAGGRVFFLADDGFHGAGGLWVSDGTEAGTRFVLDLLPGEDPFSPPNLLRGVETGGLLYFLLTGGPRPILWRSDGSPDGTVELSSEDLDILPSLVAVGSRVFFSAVDPLHGQELWTTDGTVEGTRLVADLEPGAAGSVPHGSTAFRGRLYFVATTTGTGEELWSTDGTVGGTKLVRDLNQLSPAGSEPRILGEHAGRLYFTAIDPQLGRVWWSTDGTAAGTTRRELGDPPLVLSLISAGSRFFFWSITSGAGHGLWVSDGTAAGTQRLSDVLVSDGLESARPVAFNGQLFFTGTSRRVLWKSDGTAAGTRPLLTREGEEIRSPSYFQSFAGSLFFTTFERGELFQSDGTPTGTFKLLQLQRVRIPFSPLDFELAATGPRLFFPNWDPENGSELWALEAE